MSARMSAGGIIGFARAAGGTDVDVEVVDETGSTNADLVARAATLARPLLLAAQRQLAGRGRAGRSWLSDPEGSLTFSLAWPFTQGVARMLGLPLAIGVALADALDELGVQVTLKWPNDIEQGGAKLAGILIETASAGSVTWAVIGIGINLALPDPLEQAIGRPIANAAWLAQMERDRLMAHLLDHLCACLREFETGGFAAFAARWNARHAYQDRPVRILDNGQEQQRGIARGVDAFGRLLLDVGGDAVVVHAGDVSLRSGEGWGP